MEAFVILCGGSADFAASNDGLSGVVNSEASKKSSSSALDKYTMQEKIVPLIRAIKTKEPAVGVAALNVLRQVGAIADADFVAMDILPILWNMSLGPLLNLDQFKSFMDLIKTLSARVETEQTRKLQELSGSNGNGARAKGNDDFMSFGTQSAFANGGSNDEEIDFESLVKGNGAVSSPTNHMDSGWNSASATNNQPVQNNSNHSQSAAFAWSTPSPTVSSMPAMRPQQNPAFRTVTPDLSQFGTLSPSSTQFSKPLQPQNSFSQPLQPQSSFSQPLQSQSVFTQQQPSYNQPQSAFSQVSTTS